MGVEVTIRKQKIKVITTGGQSALQVRRHINDRLQYDLIKIFEMVFSNAFLPDEYIVIDKLKLDIGKITADVFEKHFAELVDAKLRIEVQQLMTARNDSLRNQEPLFENEATKTNSSISTSSKEEQQVKALFYFLEHGIYPWWYKKNQQQSPTDLLNHLSGKQIKSLLYNLLQKSPLEVKRKMIDRLFVYLPENHHEDIIYQLSQLRNNNTLTTNVELLLNNKSDFLWLFSITDKAFYKQVFRFLANEKTEKEHGTISVFISGLTDSQKQDVQTKLDSLTLKDSPFLQTIKQAVSNKIANKESNTNSKKTSPAKAEQEGMYISNAGLILLHPFLPTFFKTLNLLDLQNQFISLEAQQKAAVLLYYMQGNDAQYKEWEMAFNKILCGISADDVLPETITITEAEKEECRDLLQSITDYWTALKGASIEAVQQIFFMREGKIMRKEDHWLLHVERTGVDILLENLPWGFTTVKLPWLTEMIYTEW